MFSLVQTSLGLNHMPSNFQTSNNWPGSESTSHSLEQNCLYLICTLIIIEHISRSLSNSLKNTITTFAIETFLIILICSSVAIANNTNLIEEISYIDYFFTQLFAMRQIWQTYMFMLIHVLHTCLQTKKVAASKRQIFSFASCPC